MTRGIEASRPRPVQDPSPPAPPLIPPTDSPELNALTDVVNDAADPFRNAPPPEQGAVGVVANGLNGVLAVVEAPAKLIDTGLALATAPLAKLFPSLPAATLLCFHLGLPHAHLHPPGPLPLPSMGPLLTAGSVSVLINGVPAARCGDVGLGLTCGSFAPPFEVMTGSSNVFIGGARAARLGDLTRHCNPASALGTFDKVMAVAGSVAGVLTAVALETESRALSGAEASGSEVDARDAQAEAASTAAEAAGKSLAATMAAAQAGADAAAFALQLLCGKDPGVPPGIGAVLGVHGNVLIGGIPMPALGQMAVARLAAKLGKLRSRKKNPRKSEPEPNRGCGKEGEPVDVTTGANFNTSVDFVSQGSFRWVRHYSSAHAGRQGPLGWGFRHEYQRELRVRLHCCTYVDEQGREVEFPRFRQGEDEVRQFGYVLRRLDGRRYTVSYRGQPTLEFQAEQPGTDAVLRRMVAGRSVLSFEYDEARRLVAITERGPGVRERYRLTYDADGHVLQVGQVRPAGVPKPVVVHAYDASGGLTEVRDALGGTVRYAYDPAHRLTQRIDARGYTFRWRYDDQGRCVWTEGEDGLWSVTLEYFPERGCTRATRGPGQVWTYFYDASNTITRIEDPHGGVLRRERDAAGRVVREIDPGGRVAELLYDEDGAYRGHRDRFGTIVPSPDALRPPLYPPAQPLPGSPLEWFLGGVMGTSSEAALGAPRSFVGALPERVQRATALALRLRAPESPPASPPLGRTQDALGRLVVERDLLGRHQEWRYDAAGNQIEHRDRDGRVYRRAITSWNLVGAEMDPLGGTSHYEYSASGRITRVTDALGNVSSYEYDAKDRLCRVYRHGKLREEYRYDVGDRLVAKLDGEGRTLLELEPHENGLPRLKRLASGGTHTLDYDARGRFTRASTHQDEVRLRTGADGRRRLDERNGRGVEHHFLRTGGARMQVLGRFVTTYQPSPGGVTVTDPVGGVHRFSLEAPGLLVRKLSNGTCEVQQFDGEGRLEGRVSWGPEGSHQRVWSVHYDYSAEGDLLRVRDSVRGETAYGCDAAHRLVEERTPAGETLRYELDAAGNVLSKPGLARAEVGPGNQLQSAGSETFAYDQRNHLTARTSVARGPVRYVHDSMDWLVRVEDGQGEPWTAEYDALGRRVRCGRGDRQTGFYWDGDRIAAEVAPDGRLRVYVYAGHEALVPFMFVDYDGVDAPPEQGRACFVFHDQVGLPLHIEDARGRVVWWAARADPYGTVEVLPGAEVEYSLRWPGHYHDADTGLHYNRFRYYDPRLGRYLESDPLGLEGGLNLYAYVPNPAVGVDLLGLMPPKRGLSDEEGHEPRPKRQASEAAKQKIAKMSRPSGGSHSGGRGRAVEPTPGKPTSLDNASRIKELKHDNSYKKDTYRVLMHGQPGPDGKPVGLSLGNKRIPRGAWDKAQIVVRERLGQYLISLHDGFIVRRKSKGTGATEINHLVAQASGGLTDVLGAHPGSRHANTEDCAFEEGLAELTRDLKASRGGAEDQVRVKITGYVYESGPYQGTLKARRNRIYIRNPDTGEFEKKYDRLSDGHRGNIDKDEFDTIKQHIKGLDSDLPNENLHGKESKGIDKHSSIDDQKNYDPRKAFKGRTRRQRNQNTHNSPYFTEVRTGDGQRLVGDAARAYAQEIIDAARAITRGTEGTPDHGPPGPSCG